MARMILSVLCLSLLSYLAEGLVAYDCTSDTADHAKLDLTDFAPCPKADANTTSHKVTVQVLQTRSVESIKVRSCKVILTRSAHGCGDFSKLYPLPGGLATLTLRVSSAQCDRMFTNAL